MAPDESSENGSSDPTIESILALVVSVEGSEKEETTATDRSEESKEVGKSKEPEVRQGSITEAKALYPKKDGNGIYQWVTEEPQDVLDAAENAETPRFAFLVRKKMSDDSRKKYDFVSIIVQSPWLKQALGVILQDYPGITTNLERLVFHAPFHPFAHRWNRLTALLEQDEFEDPVNQGQAI